MTTATVINPATIERTQAGRWVWFFTASLFMVTALAGFVPRSLEIVTGVRPNPPLVVHIHAATMAAWLGLLFFQTLLVALRRTDLHRTLGISSLVVGPGVVGAMIATTIWRFGDNFIAGRNVQAANVLLNQGRAIFYFAIFFAWAMWVRKTDSETHKRMILLASVGPFTAAFARMPWLPNTWPENPLSSHLYMFAMLVPAIAFDVWRHGRPHPAWLIGLALMLPWVVSAQFLWSTPWWTATAARLMGY